MDIQEQIESIQKEIRETPYHKATEHYIGKLRAKLARLKDKEIEKSSKKGGGGGGYSVKKQGDATVVLVGPPSVGKSTLLNMLTNAKSKIAPYAFTTVSVIPGMMEYKDAQIQVLDVPGLIEGAEEGKGRGREVLSVARAADLLILITDVEKIGTIQKIKDALERNGIRVNKAPPNVVIEKKLSGGITIHTNLNLPMSKETIKHMAQEFGIKNGEITIKESLEMEGLIDSFSSNRIYLPALEVVNKIDLKEKDVKEDGMIFISAEKDINLDKLKDTIWEKLNFLRVYLVRPDAEPSFNNPIVMKSNDTLIDVAEKIGTEFAEGKKGAKIWGEGAKHPGQEVSLTRQVLDKMQIRFI